MSRRLALLPLLLLTACPTLDPMQRQPKLEAYEEGLAQRLPPPGAVPHRPVLAPAVATGRGEDGAPVPLSPIPVDAALLTRGRTRYDISCAVCHGVLGDGESQVAMNMGLRRPPSLHLYRDAPDGYLYQVITEGFGLMPGYAYELSVEDRWAVVAYVRALQLSQHAAVDQLPPEARERLQKEGR